jgi:hypothetical protein
MPGLVPGIHVFLVSTESNMDDLRPLLRETADFYTSNARHKAR